MTDKLPAWSFSSIKKFEQCPKQYYHVKVLKQYKEPETDAMRYGTEFHEAAELYIRDGKPLPEQFKFIKGALDNLNNLPGEKLCEFEMGLTESLEPCGFKDPNVWWRGIADLIILDREKGEARVLDYKTGKSDKYADKGQLELMALAIFKFFPEITKVKAGLLFVIARTFPKENYHRDNEGTMWVKWIQSHNRLKTAHATGVWNPKPSGLCKKHCVVLECPHNGRN